MPLQYGALPLVLADSEFTETIEDYNSKTKDTNGFIIAINKEKQVLDSVTEAVRIYSDKKKWQKLIKNVMAMDNSWNLASEKYTKLYSQLMSINKK